LRQVTFMDDEAKRIILSYLTKWKTTRVSKDRLFELKEELLKKNPERQVTLPALKKWVRRVVKETTQAEKIKAVQYGTTTHAGLATITPITLPMSERVFQQSIMFDLIASRKNIERILEKLTSLKNQAAKQPKQLRNALSAEVAATRRDLEHLATKLSEIERQLVTRSER